ncbi:MAG: hypothetical protein QOG85_638 [Gaiellaceae bacterium]|nr:hypothetical protein [Gaiellaceae bacterium]
MKLAALAIILAALTAGFAATGNAKEFFRVPTCPSHAPKFTSLNGTSTHFVRPGAQMMRLCRYYKNNWADPYGLWRHRLIKNYTTVTSLTNAFNRLQPPPRGIFCVKDDGSEMALFFAYAGGTHERVIVKLSGCRFATNGRSTRSTTAKLHNRLLALSNN